MAQFAPSIPASKREADKTANETQKPAQKPEHISCPWEDEYEVHNRFAGDGP